MQLLADQEARTMVRKRSLSCRAFIRSAPLLSLVHFQFSDLCLLLCRSGPETLALMRPSFTHCLMYCSTSLVQLEIHSHLCSLLLITSQ